MAPCIFITALASCMLWIASAQEHLKVSSWIGHDKSYGPIINIFCEKYLKCTPYKGNKCVFIWKFGEETLAENEDLIDADSSRFSVDFGDTDVGYVSLLTIKYALLEDAGIYECHLAIKGVSYYGTTEVIVYNYVPPDEYPECIVSSSTTTFMENSDATFMCKSGNALPPMNVHLMLQSKHGPYSDMGYNSVVTRTLSKFDNNTMFVCHMTSQMFPTVNRTCTIGQLKVLPISPPSVTDLPPVGSITAYNRIPKLAKDTNDNRSNEKDATGGFSKWIIIGGIASAVFIILTGVGICIVSRMIKPKSKQKKDKDTIASDTDLEMCKSQSRQDASEATKAEETKNVGNMTLYALVHNKDESETELLLNETDVNDEDSETGTKQAPLYAMINKNRDMDSNLLSHSDSDSEAETTKENSEQVQCYAVVQKNSTCSNELQPTDLDKSCHEDGPKEICDSFEDDKIENSHTRLSNSSKIDNMTEIPCYSTVNKTDNSPQNNPQNLKETEDAEMTSNSSTGLPGYAQINKNKNSESDEATINDSNIHNEDCTDETPLYAVVKKR